MISIFTDATCGEACWKAKEEVCRCSCNGKNHGIYLTSGTAPERTCKISGYRYTLHSVGKWVDINKVARNINKEPAKQFPAWGKGQQTVIRSASKSQKNWTELAVFAGQQDVSILWIRKENL